jgi:large subunit ribosomal protein L10
MPTAAKVHIVDELARIAREQPTVIVVGYRGLKVSDMEALRASLKEVGGKLRIVKNSLLRLAVAGTPVEALGGIVDGPSAIAFGPESPAVAKKLSDFAKTQRALVLIGGVVECRTCDAAGVEALAKVPPRQVLLSMLVGALESPISGLAQTLGGVISKLVYALDEIREQKDQAA